MSDSCTLPHSAECERAVLASIFLKPEVLAEISLTATDFYLERHQVIFKAFLEPGAEGVPTDIRTVQAKLERRGDLDRVGGLAYLSGLDLDLPDIGRVSFYAGTVRECAIRRRLWQTASQLMRDCEAGGTETSDLLHHWAASLEELREAAGSLERQAAHGSEFKSLAQILADPAALDPPQPVVPRLAWRGRVTLLAGREKEGKSTLASAAAAAVTRGAAFLEGQAAQGDVLYLALEEHESDVASRLHRFKADPARIFIATALDRPADAIEREAAYYKPALIIVDTLAAFVGGDIEDPGNSSEWTPLMARLVRVARKHEAAVWLLHHARKSDGTYRDSTAIGAAVDVLLELRPDQEDPNLRHLKGRGRFEVPNFSVTLTATGFSLASGEMSLEARVLVFVQENSGCSMRDVTKGITGRRDSEISGTVEAMIEAGTLVDRGNGRRRAFHVAESQPAEGSGNAPGNAPGQRSRA
jgi:hypothetical protein